MNFPASHSGCSQNDCAGYAGGMKIEVPAMPNIERYVAIRCPKHGQQFLDQFEYNRQMAQPGTVWTCPAWETEDPVGVCGRPSEFDDAFLEARECNQPSAVTQSER